MASHPQKTETVFQGEFKISSDPDLCLVTVLGSCISVCLNDPDNGVGGANHFLLAHGGDPEDKQNLRFGINSMELLINGLLQLGARKSNLQAKVFGGSRMLDDVSNIGVANADFARNFLKDENIPILSESVLGNQARRVRFWPTTGKAQQLLLKRRDDPDAAPPARAPLPKAGNDIELF